MKHSARKIFLVCVMMVAATALTGCTNWKKKYSSLEVEHQNLKGLYENCVASLDGSAADQGQVNQQLADCRSELDALKRQKASVADTGLEKFGKVKVDADAGTITVTLPNAILFNSGKASLKSTSTLNQLHDVLRNRYSGKAVDVVGHTDSDPIRKTKKLYKDNWDLSAERALTVLRHLVQRGIPKERIRAVACGQSRPVASNSTSAGKAQNRRVEIVVHTR